MTSAPARWVSLKSGLKLSVSWCFPKSTELFFHDTSYDSATTMACELG